MTRNEHLQWAKDRALQYVAAGDIQNAFASITSDLRKHPDTVDHSGPELGMMLMLSGHLSTSTEMRTHIEGYR
jgi:hypothetical protein